MVGNRRFHAKEFRGGRLALLTAAAGISLFFWASQAFAMAPAEIKQKVAKDFGVTVLAVDPMKQAGRAVYLVKIMRPGGNRNDAFLVETVVVDKETGNPVRQFDEIAGTSETAR